MHGAPGDGGDEECREDEPGPGAEQQGNSDEQEQGACIHRMADEGVRAGVDHPVIFLDLHHGRGKTVFAERMMSTGVPDLTMSIARSPEPASITAYPWLLIKSATPTRMIGSSSTRSTVNFPFIAIWILGWLINPDKRRLQQTFGIAEGSFRYEKYFARRGLDRGNRRKS
jgi:hypothetical protein